MLELSHMLQADDLKLSSQIALMPRQVLLNMKKPIPFDNGTLTLTLAPEQSQNPLLHHSICQYLQRYGFSKTLKSFRSEAQLQNDEWKSCSLDLEEMCNKYLSIGGKAESTFNSHKENDLQKDAVTKEDGDRNDVASVETVSKKKKKKRDASDTNVIVDQSGSSEESEILTDDLVPELKVKSKENKKNKIVSDSRGGNSEKVDSESMNGTEKHKDKKKKKSKVISESLPREAEAKSQDVASSQGIGKVDSETEVKSKDKKKKKNKEAASDFLVQNTEQLGLDDTITTTCEKNVKLKDKKKKKEELVSESLCDRGKEELENEESKDLADAVQKEKKGSKKRKRLAFEENDSQILDQVAIDKSKLRVEASQPLVNASSEVENGQVGFNESQKTPLKHLDAHANGDLEKSGGENNTVQKARKKQRNGSVEPKTVNAFQRVKVDEVVFADNRLQNNSYWAKDGAEIGYGAKAQEVLGQVKGRDFRHEKTKKKRGSYKGGQIDLHSHSVKFNYSDDD